MVNEEDHLRLQVMRSGFALDEAWQDIDKVDDLLEQRVSYAFSEEFGYLTACPTNVGTGMRASVMLHLPALVLTKQIEKVFRALQKINLAVRGLYGEGSRASGDFYQISNQVTLGKSETTILSEIREVIPQIITYERQARNTLRQGDQAGPAGPGVPRLRHPLLGHDDDLGRDDGPAVQRAAGHQPGAAGRHHHPDGERAVHPHAAGPPAEADGHARWTARSATPPGPATCAADCERRDRSRIDHKAGFKAARREPAGVTSPAGSRRAGRTAGPGAYYGQTTENQGTP